MCATRISMSELTLLQEFNIYKENRADVCVVVYIQPQWYRLLRR